MTPSGRVAEPPAGTPEGATRGRARAPLRHLRVGGVALAALATLGYPLAVYVGLSRGHVRATALGISAVLLLVLARRARASGLGPLLVAPALGLALGALAAATGDGRLVLALPVVVNAALLAVFAASLRGESIIERLARVVDPALPPDHARYCRRVTVAWCLTFAASAAIAAGLALRGSLEAWALWTGLLSYMLIAAVGLGELAVRRLLFAGRAPGLVATLRAFSAGPPADRDRTP